MSKEVKEILRIRYKILITSIFNITGYYFVLLKTLFKFAP